MTLETTSLAGGDIEVMFLQQTGLDPFTATPERTAQVSEVAGRIARFIGEARATLDIAIYDFRLRDDAATIVADALRARARKGVVIRIAYDHATDPGGNGPTPSRPRCLPAHRTTRTIHGDFRKTICFACGRSN